MAYQQTTPTADQVAVLHNGSVPVQVGFYGGNPAAAGATTIVPKPPPGVAIVVLSLALSNGAGTANTVNLQSHTTTSVTTGNFYLAAAVGSGPALTLGSAGIFATVPGEALDINLSAATAVGVTLSYAYFQLATP